MAQTRIWDYHAPEDTELLNRRFRGIIRVGVHAGYEVENGIAGFVTIRQGVLVTADGVRVEETEDLLNHLGIPANASGAPRIDYIVAWHSYLKTLPPPVAVYQVFAGIPAASPAPPVIPADALILARGLLPAGAAAYSEIRLAAPDEVFNAAFDGQNWRIDFGNKAAYRIEHDVNAGTIRFYIVPAGAYPAGSVISWGAPSLTLTQAGHAELNSEIAARQTADDVLQSNIEAEAAARVAADSTLQGNLNSEALARSSEDTALQNALADAKGRGWNETVPADQDLAELHARLTTLESAEGVPPHRARHEAAGDDVIRFDHMADGTDFKKLTANERTDLAVLRGGGTTTLHYHSADRERGNHTGTQTPATISPQGADSGLDADLLDGQHAAAFAGIGHAHNSAYAPLAHVGAGGAEHAVATPAANGFLSAADKSRLDSINDAEFTLSGSVGGNGRAIAAYGSAGVQRLTITIPVGKTLRLKRARFYLYGSVSLRLYVSGDQAWSSSEQSGDLPLDQLICNGNQTASVFVFVHNEADVSATADADSGWWLGFVIE